MAWAKFTADFNFRATPRTHIAYKAGYVGTVTRRCLDEAIEAKCAEEVKPPKKNATDGPD